MILNVTAEQLKGGYYTLDKGKYERGESFALPERHDFIVIGIMEDGTYIVKDPHEPE